MAIGEIKIGDNELEVVIEGRRVARLTRDGKYEGEIEICSGLIHMDAAVSYIKWWLTTANGSVEAYRKAEEWGSIIFDVFMIRCVSEND